VRDASAHILGVAAFAVINIVARRRRGAGEVEDEVVADLRQFQRDAAFDATRPAGDEGHRIHAGRIDFPALE